MARAGGADLPYRLGALLGVAVNLPKLTADQHLRRDLLVAGREIAYRRSRRTRRLLAALIARRGWRP